MGEGIFPVFILPPTLSSRRGNFFLSLTALSLQVYSQLPIAKVFSLSRESTPSNFCDSDFSGSKHDS